jgi:CheY-like chemotaxis protein
VFAHHAPQNGRVLVIDDEPDCTFELVEHLEMNGLACIGMTDPKAAVEVFRQDSSIAVVVSDIKMPGMDGITLARTISKFCGETRPVALILVTGHAGLSEARQALDLGTVEFILKPIDLDDLDRSIARAFQRLDVQRVEAAARTVLLKDARLLPPQSAEASMMAAICTTMADAAAAEGFAIPAWLAAGETGQDQDAVIDLTPLSRQLAESCAATVAGRDLRLSCKAGDGVLARGRPALIEAALARLVGGVIAASANGADVSVAASMACGRPQVLIGSSAISRQGTADPTKAASGPKPPALAVELALGAIWTHLASGSLGLAEVGNDGLVITLTLPGNM